MSFGFEIPREVVIAIALRNMRIIELRNKQEKEILKAWKKSWAKIK